jgi:polysaccharide export outer membrane protein
VIGDLVTPYSSTREVTVTGPEGNKTTYDLFLSTRFGDMSQNPYIQSGDTVTVNRIDRKVTISGAVERPGTYELLKGENLKDLVEKYGGGLAPLADSSRMELYRITDEKNSGKQYYLSAKDIADNTALICYDSVKVCSYTDLQSAMFIEGAVSIGTVATNLETSSRITVTFHEGENYASLVRRMKTIFSASSDTTKAYIIRTVKAEGKGDEAAYEQKKIPINLDEILYDASFYSTEYVHKDDTLLVPFRQFFVTVAGAVNSPGRFPYIPDRTWDYYVALAGGIDSSRNSLDAVDIVDVVGKRHDKSEVIEPEVIITVKENSLLYKWNKVSGSITSILSIIATVLSIIVVTNGLRS